MGLRVSILVNKRIGECSNGGVSSRCKAVTLIGPGIEGPFQPTEDAPAVYIENHYKDRYRAVPVEGPEGTAGPMFGGSFIWCGDSRFPFPYPIPLHDRYESWEMYERMSK